MTLVVGVAAPGSIWLLADRRLTFGKGDRRDDARKIFLLHTHDGCGILGYAGLGVTAAGNEPGDWMERVLRGRNLSFEDSLAALAAAAQRELPPHLVKLPTRGLPAHFVVAMAIVGGEARIYSVDTMKPRGAADFVWRFQRYYGSSGFTRSARVVVAGSGIDALHGRKELRRLVGIVKAHEAGRISAEAVASRFAELNDHVCRSLKDGSVGPRCVVAWRYKDSGGAHQFFNGRKREEEGASARPVPSIFNGQAVNDLLSVLIPHMLPALRARVRGEEVPIDTDAIDAEMARLPDSPDETLE